MYYLVRVYDNDGILGVKKCGSYIQTHLIKVDDLSELPSDQEVLISLYLNSKKYNIWKRLGGKNFSSAPLCVIIQDVWDNSSIPTLDIWLYIFIII